MRLSTPTPPPSPSTSSPSTSRLQSASPLPTPPPFSSGSSSSTLGNWRNRPPVNPGFQDSFDLTQEMDDVTGRRRRAHGKRREDDRRRSVTSRQDMSCWNIGNNLLSCEPTANTIVTQDTWFPFTWNGRNPAFNQVDNVDIYLFSGDSDAQIGKWTELKTRGAIQVYANDTFWGNEGPHLKSGQNASFPFYFVIIPSGQGVHQGETSQATFTGIQTTLPDSIIASRSSSSVSAQSTASVASLSSIAVQSSLSTASAASLSSSAQASRSSASVYATNTGRPGSVQGDSSNNGFPNWGIALLSVLGFLAVVTMLILAYLFIRRYHRRRELSRRGSMGSASPMMAAVPTSPTTVQGHDGPPFIGGGSVARDSSVRHPNAGDGASVMSGSDHGLFSGADAAIIAEAFRQEMRKPNFSGRPVEEGESPPEPPRADVMNRELAEEGRDIRSVRSARDVHVESSSGDHS